VSAAQFVRSVRLSGIGTGLGLGLVGAGFQFGTDTTVGTGLVYLAPPASVGLPAIAAWLDRKAAEEEIIQRELEAQTTVAHMRQTGSLTPAQEQLADLILGEVRTAQLERAAKRIGLKLDEDRQSGPASQPARRPPENPVRPESEVVASTRRPSTAADMDPAGSPPPA